MKTGGQTFLDQLQASSRTAFPKRFARLSTTLGLGTVLEGNELYLLYEAAFCASLCNIAFNGLGGCGGVIKPEREPNRMKLEREFMATRASFWATSGWNRLPAHIKGTIQRTFLRVFVAEDNLAE